MIEVFPFERPGTPLLTQSAHKMPDQRLPCAPLGNAAVQVHAAVDLRTH
jgi:hypothetical protein